jgi:hypothetical protein
MLIFVHFRLQVLPAVYRKKDKEKEIRRDRGVSWEYGLFSIIQK